MWWNWDSEQTIVFPWWRTSSGLGLLAACVFVLLLTVLHEGLAFWQRRRDQEALVHEHNYVSLTTAEASYRAPGRGQRSVLYGLRTFTSILLMPVAMTFNGYPILAIIVGAMAAHYHLGLGAGGH